MMNYRNDNSCFPKFDGLDDIIDWKFKYETKLQIFSEEPFETCATSISTSAAELVLIALFGKTVPD